MRAPAALLVVGLAALAAGGLLLRSCGGGPAGPNVLLITVDTLRADRLGCYGYGRDTSPNLDALVLEGVRFARAYSHAPWTAPSHASLLTGLNVKSHGVVAWGQAITPEARTLGERLGARGWRTGAFYNHPTLEFTHVTRGFDEVQRRTFEEAPVTVEAFLEWLDGSDEPFAAWIHLWDVHRPYGYRDWTSPEIAKYAPPGKTTLAFEEQRFGSGSPETGRVEGHYNLNPTDRAASRLTAADYAFISDRYDGGVWYADRALGRLFDELRERGVLDETLVIVTSDHGEALTEREECYFTHDPFLYEETLHVPLIVRFPGGAHAGMVVGELVRGVDVLPTILEVCDAPLGNAQGLSLLERVSRGNQAPWPLLAETRTRNPKEYAKPEDDEDVWDDTNLPDTVDGRWFEQRRLIADGRFKLVEDVSRGCFKLYDLSADPGETRNLFEEPSMQAEIARLREALRRLDALLPVAGAAREELPPEATALLGGIGYVEGESKSDPPGASTAPPPLPPGSGCP